MLGDGISEKWSIDFKAIFRYLCQTSYPFLTQLMKKSGFCAINSEKFRLCESSDYLSDCQKDEPI